MLTQQRLQEVLDYDPNTGEFRWKIKPSMSVNLYDKAGSISKQTGYVIIGINGKVYKAHRLAWLYCYGIFPKKQIDHKNGQKSDNRISNLRELTPVENGQNAKKRKNNKTGITGVFFNKKDKKWWAYIRANDHLHHLGRYEDVWDAICARKSAELVYQPLRVVSSQ